MRFTFNERKTAQAATHLLSLNGGQMEYIVLIKLLYLADRRALIDHGLPITGDRMVSMPHGPVLSRVLDRIHTGPTPGACEWYEHVTEPDGYVVRAHDSGAATDELSRYEAGVLDEVFRKYGALGKWDLVAFTRTLPEWEDPHGSSVPIAPESILRAVGKSDAEIEAATEVAEELWYMSELARVA